MNRFARRFPRLYIRLFKGRGFWHNRIYLRYYQFNELPGGGGVVRYRQKSLPVQALDSLEVGRTAANVLLSGPSVREIEDPALLNNRFLVAVNGSHELFGEGTRNIDAYVVCDTDFVKRQFATFKQGVQKSKRAIMDHHIIHAALQRDRQIFDNIQLYLATDLIRPYMKYKNFELTMPDNGVVERYGVRFSTKYSTGFYSNSSVAIAVIQMLYWLKFERVYLFGMDLTPDGRFYQERQPEQTTLADDYHKAIEPSFRLISEQVMGENFSVINCSSRSRLPHEIIPKCDANSCLQASPPDAGKHAAAAPA